MFPPHVYSAVKGIYSVPHYTHFSHVCRVLPNSPESYLLRLLVQYHLLVLDAYQTVEDCTVTS
jgi:hypothetical protein